MKEENTVKEKNYTCERKKNKNKFATEKEKGKRKMFKEKMSILAKGIFILNPNIP